MYLFLRSRRIERTLARIDISLAQLLTKVDQMARTEQELSDDLDKISAGVTAALSEIADLKTQIGVISQQVVPVCHEQLDNLTAKADAIAAALTPPAPATPVV